MKTRIDRLRHPRIHIQTPPSRTIHMVSNVIVEEADDAAGVYLVSSSMLMSECRLDIQRHFTGRQFHRLERAGDSFRIRLKRVHLINCDSLSRPWPCRFRIQDADLRINSSSSDLIRGSLAGEPPL